MNRNLWLYGEPAIDDMLRDPIVHLVMRRDGITETDVRAAIEPVVEHLRVPTAVPEAPRLVA